MVTRRSTDASQTLSCEVSIVPLFQCAILSYNNPAMAFLAYNKAGGRASPWVARGGKSSEEPAFWALYCKRADSILMYGLAFNVSYHF